MQHFWVQEGSHGSCRRLDLTLEPEGPYVYIYIYICMYVQILPLSWKWAPKDHDDP